MTEFHVCYKYPNIDCKHWCIMSDPEARQKAIEEVHKKLMAEGMPDPSEFTSLTPKKHGEWVKKINEALVSYCQGGKMQEMFAEIENIRKNFPREDRD